MNVLKHLCAFVLALLLFGSSVAAAETLIFSTPGEAPYHFSDQSGIMDLWMQNAFARIGRKVISADMRHMESRNSADAKRIITPER